MAYISWGLSAVAVVGLALVALISRRLQRSWLAPGAFYAGAWFIFASLALVMVWDVEVWPGAVWWIVLTAGIVTAASSLGIAASRRLTWLGTMRFSTGPVYPALKILIVVASILGMGVVVSLLRDKGIGIDGIWTPASLARTEHTFSVARYLQDYKEPLVARLLVTSIYLAALFAGLFLATRFRERRLWIVVLPLIPALAITLVATERASLAYPLVLMAATYFAARDGGRPSWRSLLNARSVIIVVVAVVLLLGLSVLVLVGRYGYSNGSQVLSILPTVRYDAFGYLGAFSRWFQHGANVTHNLSFGGFTFAGLFDALHLRSRSPGIYTDAVQINGRSMNIFTVFRGLIQDFGFIGSMVFLSLVGFFAGLAYSEVRRGNGIAIAILAAFYAAVLWSPVVDLFAYNSVIAAWVLFTAYLAIADYRRRSSPKQAQVKRSGKMLASKKAV